MLDSVHYLCKKQLPSTEYPEDSSKTSSQQVNIIMSQLAIDNKRYRWEETPSTAGLFAIQFVLDDRVLGKGTGPNKKAAQQAAGMDVLKEWKILKYLLEIDQREEEQRTKQQQQLLLRDDINNNNNNNPSKDRDNNNNYNPPP